jgi:uncharacterized membrane protein
MFKMSCKVVASIGVMLSALLAPLAVQAQTYSAEVVTGVKGQDCQGHRINEKGNLLAYCLLDHENFFTQSFIQKEAGKRKRALPTLGGNSVFAANLNLTGRVVGDANIVGDGEYHAMTWMPGDTALTDLGTLGGANSSAVAVNKHGVILGDSDLAGDRPSHLFLKEPDSDVLRDIGGIADLAYNQALGINDKGVVIGKGFVYREGKSMIRSFYGRPPAYNMVELHDLGGNRVHASAINNAGLIVGYADLAPNSQYTAFTAQAKGRTLTPLTVPGSQSSWAADVNDSGQIVGAYVRSSDQVQIAFICTGDCSDAQDLGAQTSGLPKRVTLSKATQINARGQVLARGSDDKSYVLTPLP